MASEGAAALRTCRRCHARFDPGRNEANACRFHRSIYVCRYHPAEVRSLNIGLGDGLGYYGNGEEGWDARFWDCCGAEDEGAPGCSAAPHEPFD